MNKPTPTDAATPKLYLGPRIPRRFPSITIGGDGFSERNRIIVNQICDELDAKGIDEHWRIAALIVRAVNEYDALCKVAEAAKIVDAFSQVGFSLMSEERFNQIFADMNKALAELTAIRGQK